MHKMMGLECLEHTKAVSLGTRCCRCKIVDQIGRAVSDMDIVKLVTSTRVSTIDTNFSGNNLICYGRFRFYGKQTFDNFIHLLYFLFKSNKGKRVVLCVHTTKPDWINSSTAMLSYTICWHFQIFSISLDSIPYIVHEVIT